MLPYFRHFIGAVGIVALASAGVVTQPGSGVVRATVQHIHDTLTSHPFLSIDPRIAVFRPLGRGVGTELHPPEQIAEASIQGVSEVISLERAKQCETVGAPGCQQNGIAAFVSLSVPTIQGDLAVVDAFLRFWRQPTASDSARMRIVSPQLAARMSSVVATHFRFDLVRTSGRWRVVKQRIMGQS